MSHSCQQGATPLCVAAQEGHIKTCQILIKLGANPHQPDKCGRTPIRVAEKAEHKELAKILSQTPPGKGALQKLSTKKIVDRKKLFTKKLLAKTIGKKLLTKNC